MSVKFQITLPDDLAADLRSTAERMNVPLAEFIRNTMEQRLAQLRQRERKDPFASITGIVKCDEPDLSLRVDTVLYGGPTEE